MNKKISVLLLSFLLAFSANAQKANIQSAINYLKDKDVAGAKKMMDEATVSESTKNNARAWLLKAVIYQAIGTPKELLPAMQFVLNDDFYNIDLERANTLTASTPNAMAIALEAYKKAMAIDPKYSKDELRPLLTNILSVKYNEAITLMNENKYADAYNAFDNIKELAALDNGNLWKGLGNLDTAFANGKMYQANCAFNASKDDEALSLLEDCIKNPITQNPDLYIMLTDIYGKKNNDAKWTETMNLARAKYPNEKRILTNEINYYIDKGKTTESIAKLKDGIALEPTRADLHLLLGQTYLGIANPVDKAFKPLPRPENAKELEKDALASYLKAAELDNKNAYAQFNIGVIYNNQAKLITDEMNNKNTDTKKYDALKPGRDELLNKATPYLIKAKELIDAEGLNDGNRSMYKDVITGLMNVYNINSKAEKAAEMKKIYDTLK